MELKVEEQNYILSALGHSLLYVRLKIKLLIVCKIKSSFPDI